MSQSIQQYQALVEAIKKEIPTVSIKYKDEDAVQCALGKVLFFNLDYMTKYTSTFGKTVYFPSRVFVQSNYRRATKILAHEYVHLCDRRQWPGLFELLYSVPQVLALLSLLSFFSLWWLLCLLFLLPLPGLAFFRAVLEIRGYAMNMAINYFRYGSIKQKTKDSIVEHFTSGTYYWMFPFRKAVYRWLDRVEMGIKAKEADGVLWNSSKPYIDVFEVIR